jgi:hypothetical protein
VAPGIAYNNNDAFQQQEHCQKDRTRNEQELILKHAVYPKTSSGLNNSAGT